MQFLAQKPEEKETPLNFYNKNENKASRQKFPGIGYMIGCKNWHPWDKQRVVLYNRKHPDGAPSVYSGLRAVATA